MTSVHSALPRLSSLDLSDNLLQSSTSSVDTDDDDMETGSSAGIRFPADVFPELAELDLGDNRLESIGTGMFGNLRRLSRLRLSGNDRLSRIEPDSLAGLEGLIRLEVNDCRRLTHLRAGTLAGLNALRILSIRDSGLVHVHHAALARLQHIEEINFRNNKLGLQVRFTSTSRLRTGTVNYIARTHRMAH